MQSPISLKIQQQQQILGIYASHAVRCFFKAIQLAEGYIDIHYLIYY